MVCSPTPGEPSTASPSTGTSAPGRHFDIERAKSLPPDAPEDDAYVKYDPTSLEFARYAGNVIRRKAEEWEGYQQRFPAMIDKKIFLSIDEYAYFGGGRGTGPNLKVALAYGMLFNEMLRHTDFLTMSAHTMGVSTMDYTPTAATLNTTGLMFKMYTNHFVGTIPVALSGNSPQPATKNPPYADEPKQPSGSPTYPLDMFAALTPDHKYLTLAVVNATETEQKFNLNVTGVTARRAIDIVADDRDQPGCRQPRWTTAAGRGEGDPSGQCLRVDLSGAHQREHLSVSSGRSGAVKGLRPSPPQ